MIIGFDISQTGKKKAGCGFFADSLIQNLVGMNNDNSYILYPYFGSKFWDPDADKSTRKISHPKVIRKKLVSDFSEAKNFWGKFPADGEQRLGNPDIIHANNFFCPKNLKHAKTVFTLYDVNFLENPEYTTEENRLVCFDGVFDAANHADFVIGISHYSLEKFFHFFPHYPRERADVVYLGSRFSAESEIALGRKAEGLEPLKFWLAVGTIEPRKNIRNLLKAFAGYKKNSAKVHPLVLAGGEGWMEEGLADYISELDLQADVRILGYVSDNTLIWLYKNCFAFIYPSLYEGFGLPVLEAMSMGAAVVTSNTTSLPEVAGEAAFYVNPFDSDDIRNAFIRLGSDDGLRSELQRLALQRARKFSWEESAGKVLRIYKNLISMPKLSI